MQSVEDLQNRDYTGSVASPTIESLYANIFVFIDCENNQFLKKWIMIIKCPAGYATVTVRRRQMIHIN
jgi:hypothetical protein